MCSTGIVCYTQQRNSPWGIFPLHYNVHKFDMGEIISLDSASAEVTITKLDS